MGGSYYLPLIDRLMFHIPTNGTHANVLANMMASYTALYFKY